MRDYREEYKDYCLTCEDYEIYDKGSSTHRGFRCKRYRRPMAFDEKCNYYTFDRARGNNQIEDAVKFRVDKGYEPKPDSSYWYIVSTIRTILRMHHESNDTTRYIAAFKFFKEVLMAYPNGQRFLASYDINGVYLAGVLLNNYYHGDTQDETVEFIKNSLLPILDTFASMVEYNNYPGALKVYTRLMQAISTAYNYQPVEISSDKEVNPELIGSGRVRKLLQSLD